MLACGHLLRPKSFKKQLHENFIQSYPFQTFNQINECIGSETLLFIVRNETERPSSPRYLLVTNKWRKKVPTLAFETENTN